MSLQVGNACYASPADAGVAACAAFAPVTSIGTDGTVRTVSCSGANPDTGALKLIVTTTPSAVGGQATTAEIAQQIAFPPCIEADKIQAYTTIFGAALTAVVLCYSAWKVYSWFTVNPRSME